MKCISEYCINSWWEESICQYGLLPTEIATVFGCDSSPRSPNVSVSVCHTCYNCTKALNFKVFRLKDFWRTSKGLPKDFQRTYKGFTSRSPQVFKTCLSLCDMSESYPINISQNEKYIYMSEDWQGNNNSILMIWVYVCVTPHEDYWDWFFSTLEKYCFSFCDANIFNFFKI